MSLKTTYKPLEITNIVRQAVKYNTVDEVNTHIDSVMLPGEVELLEGVRHACLYYLSKSSLSECSCDLTMEKLIANEIPLEERLKSPYMVCL